MWSMDLQSRGPVAGSLLQADAGRPHDGKAPRLTDAIVAAAAHVPAAVAIDVPGERLITYIELLQLVDDAASRLDALGLAHASCVGVVAPNEANTLIALLALSRVVTVVPLNPTCTRTELLAQIERSRAAMLIVLSDGRGPWDDLDAGISVVRWASLGEYEAAAEPPSRRDEAAFLFETSGTTGSPIEVGVTGWSCSKPQCEVATKEHLPSRCAERGDFTSMSTVILDGAGLKRSESRTPRLQPWPMASLIASTSVASV